ncbi:MAG TPA: GGDEF domain-containing protein [Acidimicrobiales bacterium]|nr:GGDEF domain-containing protein [Acidimicrobiales bacterium]
MAETHPTPSDEQRDDVELAGLGGDDRDQTADERDHTSEAFDKASDDRDERADARDARAESREGAESRFDPGAVSDRAGAKRDRQGGASDRKHAEHDREAASTDRDLSARERATFLVDELTGAHRREAGILELEREITRAKRTKHPFVLVFIDVDRLKATNDSQGHAAGDELLRHVVDTIRAHVRPYDLIVRYGGDEFLCGLPDLTAAEAAERFGLVNVDLASRRQASVTAGMAELSADDRVEDLIKRADDALYRERRGRSAAGE